MMEFLETAGLFSDCWDLYRRYYSEELDEDVCEKLVGEVDILHKKYGRQKMAKEMLVSVLNEIQDIDNVRCRTGKEKGQGFYEKN